MRAVGPSLLLGHLALLTRPAPAYADLTAQEMAECNAQAELFELEMRGGVGIELALFMYTIVVMHVLIEEWYVPALELVTSPDVLDVPRPLLGCTIMAAANCLPELSMSLAAMLLSESQDIGTGEVFGSCVFDLLAILGVVGLLAPTDDGIRLAPPLLLYFLAWAAIGTLVDASLFFGDDETMWPASLTMLGLYVAFVGGAFLGWRVIPGFVGDDETSALPARLAITASDGRAAVGDGVVGLSSPTAITQQRAAQRREQRVIEERPTTLHPSPALTAERLEAGRGGSGGAIL